ncbi:MAG: VIT family protein [Thiopseudomonas sp.]|jgi:VIT1/CCC1 family predicted Fe2+/Mn2+ transporter|nr:VIT family protein [Thiopseudomonas sp.]MBP8008386.1 VIT family protein [Thiopseudomonas sp.]MBP8771057.1 VIT family protein [Thiopseudomonas sp.]NLU13539.1 VIT family protein [Gammaproteobacteria bacterium]HHX05164.1 VIT family protein [Pseudomonas sp.]
MPHPETHKVQHIGLLRAAVLGANDGILSTASLVLGVVASGAETPTILLTGVAGLVAGAMSMAAGEYVSVSSQTDTEQADLAIERRELANDPEYELAELAGIYRQRGLDAELAQQVAVQLTAHDALAAHARDELGLTDEMQARPVQAAFSSALTFSVGAFLPLLMVLIFPASLLLYVIPASALLFLMLLGGLAAYAGGASVAKGAYRVGFWGALAMGLTTAVGTLFGVAV